MMMAFGQDDKLRLLKSAFAAGLEAVRPVTFMTEITAEIMADNPDGKLHLLAVGKAAGAMAEGFFNAGGKALSSLVILPEGVTTHLPEACHIIHSAHPVPNQASEAAAKAALSLADNLGADDKLVVLLSGGGSSLMCLGLGDVTLQDKQQLNATLLSSGMAIQEMNIIRKHVSAIKAGRLAIAAFPARLSCYARSAVPGDAPDAIASGPVSGDDSTSAQARALITKHKLSVPESIINALEQPQSETPFNNDERLRHTSYKIIASANHALEASAAILRKAGYQIEMMGDSFQDDTPTLADIMVSKLATVPDGTALISGGEASVRVDEDVTDLGIGGRNAQFALEMARRNLSDICGISCDTDGIDGSGKNAGALFYYGLRDDAQANGIEIDRFYQRYDSHGFFEAMDCHIRTGPTQTNVNDLRLILKGAPQKG